MRYILLILFMLSLSGCDPIKRHNRIVEKFPHVHKKDTTVVNDTTTTIVAEVKADTVVLTEKLKDTVVVQKERLRVQVHTIHDSVYIDGECGSDTIIQTKEVIVPTFKSTEKDEKRLLDFFDDISWVDWLKILVILAAVYLIIRAFRG